MAILRQPLYHEALYRIGHDFDIKDAKTSAFSELIKTQPLRNLQDNNGSTELSRCNPRGPVSNISNPGGNRSHQSVTSAESSKPPPARTATKPIVTRTYWPSTVSRPAPRLGKGRTSRSEVSRAIPGQATSTSPVAPSPPKGEPGGKQHMSRNAYLIGYSRHQPGSTAKSCSSHGDPPPYLYVGHIVGAAFDNSSNAVKELYDTSHEITITVIV